MKLIAAATFPRRRPAATALLLGLALLLAWLGWRGALVWRDIERLRPAAAALQSFAAAPPARDAAGLAEGCRRAEEGADALAQLDADVRPLAPLLRLLAPLPRLGPTLAAAPDLAEAGAAAGRAAQSLCGLARGALPLLGQLRAGTDRPAALAALVAHAHAEDARLALAARELALADTALGRVEIAALAAGPLATYAPRLERAAALLGPGRAALEQARALLPLLATLGGADGPQSFLLLLQNNSELRATGGFVGTVAQLTAYRGHLHVEQIEVSSDLDQIAPPATPIPFALRQYAGIHVLHLRNANWWPDFPQSARTIESLWSLNNRPAPAGVIAVDLHALQAIIAVLGPLDLPRYGRVEAPRLLDELFGFYERGGAIPRDRTIFQQLARAMLGRLPNLDAAQAQRLAAALVSALDQRHIQLSLHDEAAQAALARFGWDGDGAARWDGGRTADDYLRVVDSDVSFSDGWGYVQQRIGYEVWLAGPAGSAGTPALKPISSTVTIDYWNRYDAWRQSQSSHQVYSRCQDLKRGLYIFLPGCTGDFVRVYRPALASLSGATGLDEPPQARGEGAWLTVGGGYLLLYPGERQRARFSYQHLAGAGSADGYRLLVQKQAGTLARPLRLSVHLGDAPPLVLDTDLSSDRSFSFALRDGALVAHEDTAEPLGAGLLPPSEPPAADPTPPLAQLDAFDAGLQAWQAGDTAGALAAWRCAEADCHAAEMALGAANALRWQGRDDEAIRLAQALLEDDTLTPDAAALGKNLMGDLLTRRGRDAEAERAYRASLALDATNGSAQLGLAGALHRLGRSSEAAALLWNSVDAQHGGTQLAQLALLADVAPDDWRVYAHWGDVWLAAQPPTANDIYGKGLARLPNSGELLRRRGQALIAMGRTDEALAALRRCLALNPADAEAAEALRKLERP